MEKNVFSSANNYVFMAFATGKETVESAPIKRYIGVAPFFVVGVNPNKAQTKELMGYEPQEEPSYVVENEGVKSARIDFIIKTDTTKTDVELITRATYWIRNEKRFNKDKTKVQVIDKYGVTAWVTPEELKEHATMLTKNDGSKYQSSIDKDYRPAYVGEEAVTNFIKVYLGIPNTRSYVNGTWVSNPNVKPEECEARFENLEVLFNGNFKDIKDVVSYQPNNKIKLMLGVRTTDDNKQYQAVYTDMPLRASATDYSKLDKDLQEKKNAGAYATTEFKTCNLEEYTVEATNFNNTPITDPFADNSAVEGWGFNS